jgi:hypothetical protein
MPFDRLSGIVDKAFDDLLDKTGSGEGDPDLNRYNQLMPSDFKGLEKRFGKDEVDRYIKTMEAKRMGVE